MRDQGGESSPGLRRTPTACLSDPQGRPYRSHPVRWTPDDWSTFGQHFLRVPFVPFVIHTWRVFIWAVFHITLARTISVRAISTRSKVAVRLRSTTRPSRHTAQSRRRRLALTSRSQRLDHVPEYGRLADPTSRTEAAAIELDCHSRQINLMRFLDATDGGGSTALNSMTSLPPAFSMYDAIIEDGRPSSIGNT